MKPGLKLSIPSPHGSQQHGGGVGSSGASPHAALSDRVAHFRSDPDKMAAANRFVDDLVAQAQTEAEKRARDMKMNSTQKPTTQATSLGGAGSRRTSDIKSGNPQRVVSRARGVVVRWFENICNCTNTAIARRTFFKTNRSASAAAGGAGQHQTQQQQQQQ